MLCTRFLIVGVRCAKLQAEGSIVSGLDIVKIGMLAGVLCGLCRACGGICGACTVPLARIGQTQAVVVADGLDKGDAVVVVGAVAAVAGLVAVGYALVAERMLGLMLHLAVARAIGVSI